MIVFPGGMESSYLEKKLNKVLDSFATARYEFPSNK